MQRIRPEDWYSVRRLDDDVTAISEPYIQEFYRCNIWHIRGRDRDMLVDSGMGVVSLRQWVPLVTEREMIAVASHTHFDHIGCHHEFECRAVHSAEADLLAEPTRKNTLADPYVTDEIFDALPPEPYCSKCYAVKKAPATRILEGAFTLLGQPAELGALPTLMAATADLPGSTYVGPDGPAQMRGTPRIVAPAKRAHDRDAQRRLWEISETATGVRYP